jgi:hypothetical protein
MREEARTFVRGKSSPHRSARAQRNNRRKTMPLFGINDQIVRSLEHSGQIAGAMIEQYPRHRGAQRKDVGVTPFR